MSYIYRARIHINNGVHDDVLQANGKKKEILCTYDIAHELCVTRLGVHA